MNYPDPFIPERADPYIIKGPDGLYYFTASYPAYGGVDKGYDRIVLRRSDTVIGLRDAEEHVVWKAHTQGSMGAHIWAPELHYIGGYWYLLFAAGDKEDVWKIRPYFLRCEGNDPITGKYTELGRAQALLEDKLSFEEFSLDMTYFEDRGSHYVIWAEKKGRKSESVLLLAKIDPSEPNRLKSMPIVLSRPEYDWEKVRYSVNEGASVLKHGNMVYVFFSASGTGEEYCVGMLRARSGSDLTDISVWEKYPEPVLSTADLDDEEGPGHNSFVVDENGDQLIVYHSRPKAHSVRSCGTYCDEPLYDPCRHARIRGISFDDEGLPIIK